MKISKSVLAMLPVCMVEFLTTQDFAIVNGSLGGIAASYGVPVTRLHWVLSAQMLVVGALLVPAGSAGDRFGRKVLFVSGLLVSMLGYLVVFAAPSFAAVIAGRIVAGCGMAMTLPVALSLVADLFSRYEDKDKALAAIATAQLVGLPCGAQVGGMLIASSGWRYAFLANAAVALLTIPVALSLLPRSRRAGRRLAAPPDAAGLVLVAGLSALLVWTVSRVSEEGLRSGAIAWLAPCVALGYALARVESRARYPILPLTVLAKPSFLRAWGLVALITCFNAGLIFTASLYLQRSGGGADRATLTLFAPMAGASLLGTWLIPRLVERSSRSMVIRGGLAIDTLLLVAVALLAPGSFRLLPATMVLVSLCMLAIFVPAQTEALADADAESRGVVSSLLKMAYYLPTGMGIAAVGGALAAGGARLALFTVAAFGLAAICLYSIAGGLSVARAGAAAPTD
jgi:predicted MFS family arabinose efflux permease